MSNNQAGKIAQLHPWRGVLRCKTFFLDSPPEGEEHFSTNDLLETAATVTSPNLYAGRGTPSS